MMLIRSRYKEACPSRLRRFEAASALRQAAMYSRSRDFKLAAKSERPISRSAAADDPFYVLAKRHRDWLPPNRGLNA